MFSAGNKQQIGTIYEEVYTNHRWYISKEQMLILHMNFHSHWMYFMSSLIPHSNLYETQATVPFMFTLDIFNESRQHNKISGGALITFQIWKKFINHIIWAKAMRFNSTWLPKSHSFWSFSCPHVIGLRMKVLGKDLVLCL